MKRGKILKNIFLAFNLTILFCLGFSGCKADEEIVQEPVTDNLLRIARESLQDSIVFYAKAMMGAVDRTRLEKGCPVKYFFSWKSEEVMNIQIRGFSVGNMPVTIWYFIDVKFMKLNTWEKQEYPGSGWVKFQGSLGKTFQKTYVTQEEMEAAKSTGGHSTGYFNAETKEMEFTTNFNAAGMSTDVYRQAIDYSRMATYDEDFAQYERDLKKYKEEHGL